MAIGNKNAVSNKNTFSVRTIVKDADKKPIDPYFSFVQKIDGKYTEVQQSKSFDGVLVGVTTKIEEYQGNPIKKVTLKIEDDTDAYYLDFSYTILSRSVFNCLLSVNIGQHLKFSLYQTKPNDKGQRFPQISLWLPVDGSDKDELVRWKHGVDALPKVKKVRVKGQDISDTEDIDNFFEAALQEHFSGKRSAPAPKTPAAAPAKAAVKATPKSKTIVNADDEGSSDILF